MADNPDIQWALKILTPDPDYEPSYYEKYGPIVGIPLSFVGGACFRNRFLGKPAFSGIQVHIISALLSFVATYKVTEFMKNRNAERDQMLRHYVMLHPEDFPEPERKKWGEVFEKWYPHR
ncbi:PREDICTED: NADH dehydrogenase [ubiquinone] 1 subunit C2 [Polistes dominula]|uniref:NADH dehydrogenase [ubiquinone] 1 subunit C2 n=1 Tax=Polistes dominula TaxID=743375 RepID=A0ABM1IP16_POLDO|nr:PREDICTED: NADH dehydrogenase [ubiquinone] 1 subunit C2 [Polistes dominula]XP_015181953.1 PREDICTED: NADH dehydrogenase [ubiquinone] 1 subunit C2 [Polistes dominula]